MADESDLEKTESPSPRRLEQAREDGNAPHSRELGTFAVLFAAVSGLALFGQPMADGLKALLRAGLLFDRRLLDQPELMMQQSVENALSSLMLLSPWLMGVFLLGVLAPLTLSGFLFSTKKLAPDFSRLSPTRGLGNMFSSAALMELLKAIVKAVLVGGLALIYLWQTEGSALEMASLDVNTSFVRGASLVQQALFLMVGALAVVVAMDVPYQLWRFYDELKMTREELKQEARETDGDPQLKSRIRNQQRAMARRRMMSEVPKADFVVTNPSHFSVALKYDGDSMRAPRVLAKGRDLIALNIRVLAEKHNIPILEQAPLARSLYRYAELEQEIPAGLYAAVAEVLAYIYQLRAFEAGTGPLPLIPKEVEVPMALMVGAEEALAIDGFRSREPDALIEVQRL